MSFAHAGVGQITASPGFEWSVFLHGDPPRTAATLYIDEDKTRRVGSSFNCDDLGQGSFYAAPGLYDLVPTITPPGDNYFPVTILVPVNPLDAGGGGSFQWNPVYVASGSGPHTASANDLVISDGVQVNLPVLDPGEQVAVMRFGGNVEVLDVANDESWILSNGFSAVVFVLTPAEFGAPNPFWHPVFQFTSNDVENGVGGVLGATQVVALQGLALNLGGMTDGQVIGQEGGELVPVLGSGISITENAGPEVTSGLVPIAIPKQPLVQLGSGVIQPQPPQTGFSFPGASSEVTLSGLSQSMYWICAGPTTTSGSRRPTTTTSRELSGASLPKG